MQGRSVLFAGPTISLLSPKLIAATNFEILPPARRGDIAALLDEAPGRIVLVDGHFHQVLSVGHAELRDALASGWEVWGLSSMGAIRAFEMRALGMKGYGLVYGHFLAEEDFQDDEVALLHAPEWPYEPASEPLVHLRHFVAALERDSLLSFAQAQSVVSNLKGMWYGYRTLDRMVAVVLECAGSVAAQIALQHVRNFSGFRIKALDLSRFLSEAIWLDDSYVATPSPAPYSN
jgi:hypothetical protein